MTPISAELEKFTNFTAIDGTAALPSKELPLVRVVRAPDPTISSSPPSPRMSDVAPTQPAKENISLRGQPQELLQPLEYPSLEEPKRSLGKLFQRQKFVPGSGIAQEIKSTELEKKQSNYSNSLTPVNSLSDIGISDSVTPAIKLVIVGDGQCGKTSLIMCVYVPHSPKSIRNYKQLANTISAADSRKRGSLRYEICFLTRQIYHDEALTRSEMPRFEFRSLPSQCEAT